MRQSYARSPAERTWDGKSRSSSGSSQSVNSVIENKQVIKKQNDTNRVAIVFGEKIQELFKDF